jgi:undecaprenyl diphosphate synthase
LSNALQRLVRRTAAAWLPRRKPSRNGKTATNGTRAEATGAAPHHLVIIPDGNRRWARDKKMPALEGHRRGAAVVEDLVWQCKDSGVKVLTLWGFSTENWQRSPDEVEGLMDLFVEFLQRVEKHLHNERVRFRQIGRKDRLPERLSMLIARIEAETAEYSDYYLNLCLDYGGRDEILRAVRRAIEAGVDPESLDEETLAGYLDTAGIPDPDLILRTSGEVRLSGVLPFQSVYSELAFVDVHLPDMTKDMLLSIFDDYAQRQRRFGK